MSEQRKACTKCGEEKPFDEFYKDKHHPTGRVAHCKECKRIYYEKNGARFRERARRKWSEMSEEKRAERNERYRGRYRDDPERYRSYKLKHYHSNADEINERVRQKRREDPEKFREYDREWKKKNREKLLHQERTRRQNHPERYRESSRKYRDRNLEALRVADRASARDIRELSKLLVSVPPGTKWSEEEDEILLHEDGKTVYQKSVELGRTYTSCQWRHAFLRKELNNAA